MLPLSIPKRAYGLVAIGLLAGCSAEQANADVAPDAGGWTIDASQEAGYDAETPDAALDGPDVGEADAEPLHPCLLAPSFPLSPGDSVSSVTGTINPEIGEADYYRFEASAGEAILLQTTVEVAAWGIAADPALTLLRGDGSDVLASWDDSTFAHDKESVLVTRFVDDGTYCVRIEHASSWSKSPPLRSTMLLYQLSLGRLASSPDVTLDKEPNNSPATAQPVVVAGAGQFFLALGELDGADDVDVYRVPAAANAVLEVDPFTGGPGGPGVNGNGSTLTAPHVEISDSHGSVLARTQMDVGSNVMITAVSVGEEHFVTIRRRPGSVPSSNDFYFLIGGTLPPPDHAEAEAIAGQNDEPATAEPTSFLVRQFEGVSEHCDQHFASGIINDTADGGPVDIDLRSFSAEGLETLEVFCHAKWIGSGLLNPRFAILDPSGQVMREAVETSDSRVVWGNHYEATAPPLELPEPGTYYLRVTADGQQPDIAGRDYWCILYKWPG